jgi:hypothetical protein
MEVGPVFITEILPTTATARSVRAGPTRHRAATCTRQGGTFDAWDGNHCSLWMAMAATARASHESEKTTADDNDGRTIILVPIARKIM